MPKTNIANNLEDNHDFEDFDDFDFLAYYEEMNGLNCETNQQPTQQNWQEQPQLNAQIAQLFQQQHDTYKIWFLEERSQMKDLMVRIGQNPLCEQDDQFKKVRKDCTDWDRKNRKFLDKSQEFLERMYSQADFFNQIRSTYDMLAKHNNLFTKAYMDNGDTFQKLQTQLQQILQNQKQQQKQQNQQNQMEFTLI